MKSTSLPFWPKCAQCGKPADGYDVGRDDEALMLKISVHHHGKTHVIRKCEAEAMWMTAPLEAFTPGWNK